LNFHPSFSILRKLGPWMPPRLDDGPVTTFSSASLVIYLHFCTAWSYEDLPITKQTEWGVYSPFSLSCKEQTPQVIWFCEKLTHLNIS